MIRYVKNSAVAAVAALLVGLAQIAAAQEFVELPKELEIELALSALPADLRDGATV